MISEGLKREVFEYQKNMEEKINSKKRATINHCEEMCKVIEKKQEKIKELHFESNLYKMECAKVLTEYYRDDWNGLSAWVFNDSKDLNDILENFKNGKETERQSFIIKKVKKEIFGSKKAELINIVMYGFDIQGIEFEYNFNGRILEIYIPNYHCIDALNFREAKYRINEKTSEYVHDLVISSLNMQDIVDKIEEIANE